MNRDIRIDVNIFENPKIMKLIYQHGGDGFMRLIRLFTYAAKHRPKGILYGMDDPDLAVAMGYAPAEIEKCLSMKKTMLGLKILENGDDSATLAIHGWEEHNGYVFHSDERSQRAKKAANARWGKKLKKHAKKKNSIC